ncbi:MAG: MFS transporter [Nocardiopsaceae bacterium]|jgi:MFS family permease|nr:MFS transporter [Nocardiopsaceae bacterium]
MTRRRGGLLWHRDFRWLWSGESISQLGTQVTVIALPLIAVKTLAASTFGVGVLVALQYAAFLLLGLPVGAWVDRMRRRPVMIAADVARAVLLATLPLAAAFGVLTIYQLYAVALLHGGCTLFFDVAYQSYLPSLVDRSELVEGNAKLQASESVAQVAGPALGGFLVQAVTAPFAVLADAVSFVLSAGSLRAIRMTEPPVPRAGQRSLRREIAEGLRFVLGHPILRAIAGCTGSYNFFGNAFQAVAVVFLVRQVGVSPGVIGVLFSAGSAGAIAGALTASAAGRRLGTARAIWVPLAVTGPLAVIIALTFPGPGLILFAAGWFGLSFSTVVYNVNQVAYRQALCPPGLLGRMNATMRFLVWGTIPLGGLAGGALGTALGNRGALWVILSGQALSVLWLLASPLRTARDLPTGPAGWLPAREDQPPALST